MFLASLSKDVDFVHEITFSNSKGADCLRTVTTEKDSVPRNVGSEAYFLNRNRLKIKLVEPQSPGIHNEELFIVLKTGEKLRLPISWATKTATIFEPSPVYILNPKPAEIREFQILYNTRIGGKIRTIKIPENNLKITGENPKENHVLLNVSLEIPDGRDIPRKLGEIQIETESGKTHLLEILRA